MRWRFRWHNSLHSTWEFCHARIIIHCTSAELERADWISKRFSLNHIISIDYWINNAGKECGKCQQTGKVAVQNPSIQTFWGWCFGNVLLVTISCQCHATQLDIISWSRKSWGLSGMCCGPFTARWDLIYSSFKWTMWTAGRCCFCQKYIFTCPE